MIHYWDNAPSEMARLVEEDTSSQSMRECYLYILTDPREKCVGWSYVGYSFNPEERLKVHMKECLVAGRRSTHIKNTWLWTLEIEGLKPTITILGSYPESEIKMVENDAIMMDKAIRGHLNTNIQVRDW